MLNREIRLCWDEGTVNTKLPRTHADDDWPRGGSRVNREIAGSDFLIGGEGCFKNRPFRSFQRVVDVPDEALRGREMPGKSATWTNCVSEGCRCYDGRVVWGKEHGFLTS